MLDSNNSLIARINNETECPLSRDEIVSRRKLKVAARKQFKKLEKQKVNENTTNLDKKQEFSLQLASEDFPTLDALKTKKRINISNQETRSRDVENFSAGKISVINESKSNKNVEKSWKPKVKDPIHINLSQALQNTTEKHKPVVKKADQPTQRYVLAGNILDSDNPKRKKGKVRPDKVQKPSKLKSHILNERKKKLSESKENNSELKDTFESTENNDINLSCAANNTYGDAVLTSCDLTEAREFGLVSEEEQKADSQNVMCSVLSSSIHSRRFREYCTNCLTEELTASVLALLEKVAYFQDRMYAREPIKASAKRRYVAGINQVSKYLQVRKVKLLVIAPDLERNPGEGGLDEKVQFFKMEAESQSIPCIFGPNRKRLGRAVKKNTLVSCVAVLSYEGAEEQYTKVLEALNAAKMKYLRITGTLEDTMNKTQDINLKVEDNYAAASDVTSSLLATLREEYSPADRLLNAIQHNEFGAEE